MRGITLQSKRLSPVDPIKGLTPWLARLLLEKGWLIVQDSDDSHASGRGTGVLISPLMLALPSASAKPRTTAQPALSQPFRRDQGNRS